MIYYGWMGVKEMKKLVALLVVFMMAFVLTGCDTVEIIPGEIGLMFDDPEWNDDGDLVLTVYITNGLEEEYLVNDLIVEVYTHDEEYFITYFWDDLNIKIQPDEYEEYTITFYSEYFDISKADLEELGYEISTVDDISVYFEVNPETVEQ